MRKKFFGYYKPTQQEFTKIWREAIFVFDTSVLLNIYRYTPKTREDFFKILEQLKSRIWIPHQVALEYHEQRENVISQQNSIYDDIEGTLSYLQKNVINKYKKGHPFADTSKIRDIFEEAVIKAKDVLHAAQSEHPDLLTEDIHLDRLTRLLKDDQIGDEFPKERVHNIYA